MFTKTTMMKKLQILLLCTIAFSLISCQEESIRLSDVEVEPLPIKQKELTGPDKDGDEDNKDSACDIDGICK